jgi:hypothetical protein
VLRSNVMVGLDPAALFLPNATLTLVAPLFELEVEFYRQVERRRF